MSCLDLNVAVQVEDDISKHVIRYETMTRSLRYATVVYCDCITRRNTSQRQQPSTIIGLAATNLTPRELAFFGQ